MGRIFGGEIFRDRNPFFIREGGGRSAKLFLLSDFARRNYQGRFYCCKVSPEIYAEFEPNKRFELW
jgi:hypothetical protein